MEAFELTIRIANTNSAERHILTDVVQKALEAASSRGETDYQVEHSGEVVKHHVRFKEPSSDE